MEFEQLECFVQCNHCHDEIFWGDAYYRYGDYVFCVDCLPQVAEILLHCRRCVLGQEEP